VLGGVAIALVLAATGGRVATLAPLAAIARRANLPWRVTELQSAVCGGRPGLSDGRTAALWLTDTLFALLRLGAAQADVHTWDHARYALFALRCSVITMPDANRLVSVSSSTRSISHGASTNVAV